ncbi:MAG: hypothetical protein K1W34_09900 [Lachnospiraceae bacterium]
MSVHEQAVQMISSLSDDNVKYLIDFMKRFMLPNEHTSLYPPAADTEFMQELEALRIRAKSYFPAEFDSNKIWEEEIEQKYDSVN